MGEYHVEVRSESFYLAGQHNGAWVREVRKGRKPTKGSELLVIHRAECEVRDDEVKPRGQDWQYLPIKRRHAIYHYSYAPHINQGSVEILIEDIPKIRAALDLVEQHVEKRG